MYDVIVVGGGIVGMSTAYHLVCAGAKTLLIDREDRGRATDAELAVHVGADLRVAARPPGRRRAAHDADGRGGVGEGRNRSSGEHDRADHQAA